MKKLVIIGATALLIAAGRSAQAQLVPGSAGSATFTSTASGSMTVNYFVDYNGSVYTYVYEFTAPSKVQDFEVNASYVSSVLASGNSTISTLASADLTGSFQTLFTSASSTYDYTSTGTINLDPDNVEFTINPEKTGPLTFAYTSLFAPTAGTGSAIDTSVGPWGDNGGTGSPIPVPVPEASTVMAGALMLLPLGIGAIRAVRKERVA